MKSYTKVSRKTIEEDRISICPNFGCKYMKRIKPLKFRFIGFGKYPKCKKHHIPMVYVDEMIGDFVDAALACFFDKAGLPPKELIENVKSNFPQELELFVKGWVYCITVGRGAPVISKFMDSISNAYLKQLTKKQIKSLKKENYSRPNLVNEAIKNGMDEIAIQYTRILKHLRAHSEIFNEYLKLESLSKDLRKYLNDWQKFGINHKELIKISDCEMTLKEIKCMYDKILNIGTCRCLLGLNPESNQIEKAKINAFDRFSAYGDFFSEGLTEKFKKSDIKKLYKNEDNYKNIVDNDKRSSSKQIGDYSEIKLIESLLKVGKKVLIPFGDSQRYDILFEGKRKIYPVQVKTISKKGYFPIKSNKKEYEKISHFGIYNREEEQSFLVPKEILYSNYSTMAKLRDDLKNEFKIKNIDYVKKKFTSLENIVNLMGEGKFLLNQLSSGIENIIYYDRIENSFQKIHHMDNSDSYNNPKRDLYPINIAADLMTAGFIISQPVISDSSYDFVIKKEYNLNKSFKEGFKKIKIIKNSDDIDNYREDVDFLAFYEKENDKSFLIPTNPIGLDKEDKFLINRYNHIFEEMSASDLGDAMELRIGAKFENQNYRVFFPLIGRQIYDLVFEHANQYYRVQVKTGRKYKEKDSFYFRFDTSTKLSFKSDERTRRTYKGKIDFICSVDRDTLKCYIMPIDKVPRIGVKLKLNKRKDTRYTHHGTMWAEDFEFSKLKNIIKAY